MNEGNQFNSRGFEKIVSNIFKRATYIYSAIPGTYLRSSSFSNITEFFEMEDKYGALKILTSGAPFYTFKLNVKLEYHFKKMFKNCFGLYLPSKLVKIEVNSLFLLSFSVLIGKLTL